MWKLAVEVDIAERDTPLVHPMITRLVYGKNELRPMTPEDHPRFQAIADYMHASRPAQLSRAKLLAGPHSSNQFIKQIHRHKDEDTGLEDFLGTRDSISLALAGLTPEAIGQLPALYMPHANTAVVNEASPGVAIHELGHGVDLQRGEGQGKWRRYGRWGLKPLLWKEFSAWRKGRNAYQEGFAASPESEDPDKLKEYQENMQSYNKRKYPAYGTYVGGGIGGTLGTLGPLTAALISGNPDLINIAAQAAPITGLLGGLAGVGAGALGGKGWAWMREGANKKKALRQLQELKERGGLDEIAARLQQIREERKKKTMKKPESKKAA